jgi:hypothetical protein
MVLQSNSDEENTHLELALSLTTSFTCSRVVGFLGAASLLPPRDENTAKPVAARVPRARYSFLIVRPRMTLAPGDTYNGSIHANRRVVRTQTWVEKVDKKMVSISAPHISVHKRTKTW